MPKQAKPKVVVMRGTYAYANEYSGEEHFYDGSLQVVNGIVEVPVERYEWVERLLATGYEIVTDDEHRR